MSASTPWLRARAPCVYVFSVPVVRHSVDPFSQDQHIRKEGQAPSRCPPEVYLLEMGLASNFLTDFLLLREV